MQEHHPNQSPEESGQPTSDSSEPASNIIDAEVVENHCSNEQPGSPVIGYYRPPRLTIAYLLIWITLSAVLMKITMKFLIEIEPLPTSAEWFQTFYKSAWYISSGVSAAGLLGTLVIVIGKLRGASGRLQPGHWLLLILTSLWFVHTVTMAVRLLLQDSHSSQGHTSDFVWYLYALTYLMMTIGYLLLTILPRDAKQWRLLMATQMIISLTQLVYYFLIAQEHFGPLDLLHGIITLFNVINLLVLLVVVIIDLALKRWRDGLHWLGAAQLGWSGLFYLVWTVLWKFAQHP